MTEKRGDPNAPSTDEAGITTGGSYQKVDGGTRHSADTRPAAKSQVFDRPVAAMFGAGRTLETRPFLNDRHAG